MTRIISLAFSFLIIYSCLNAQIYKKEQNQFNAGVGASGTGFPVYAGFDIYVMKDVTVGGEGNLRAWVDHWNGNNYTQTIVGITANSNYHFADKLQIPKEIDVYAGMNLGYYFWFSPSGYHGSNSSRPGIGGQVGGKYFFTRNMGANFEIVGGTAFYGFKVGLSFKL